MYSTRWFRVCQMLVLIALILTLIGVSGVAVAQTPTPTPVVEVFPAGYPPVYLSLIVSSGPLR